MDVGNNEGNIWDIVYSKELYIKMVNLRRAEWFSEYAAILFVAFCTSTERFVLISHVGAYFSVRRGSAPSHQAYRASDCGKDVSYPSLIMPFRQFGGWNSPKN